jgi:hypothetical protein
MLCDNQIVVRYVLLAKGSALTDKILSASVAHGRAGDGGESTPATAGRARRGQRIESTPGSAEKAHRGSANVSRLYSKLIVTR